MKVFVTGGNGFVGLNIVSALKGAGHDVIAIVRPGSNVRYLEPFGVELVRGSLDDAGALTRAMSGAEAVIHTAGNTSCKWSDLPALEAVNVKGTGNVIDAALRNGVRRLVYTSTTSTVGAFDDAARTADENVPLTGYRARSPYAVTKQRAEAIVFDAQAKGLETIVLNPAEVVGAYDHNLQWGRLVVAAYHDQIPFNPPGGATYCSAADVGLAHVSALTGGRSGERYLLGGEHVRFQQFLAVIADVIGKPFRIPDTNYTWLRWKTSLQERFPALMPGKPPVEGYRMRVWGSTYYYDSGKAERELGYRSAPIREMVSACAAWYQANGFFG